LFGARSPFGGKQPLSLKSLFVLPFFFHLFLSDQLPSTKFFHYRPLSHPLRSLCTYSLMRMGFPFFLYSLFRTSDLSPLSLVNFYWVMPPSPFIFTLLDGDFSYSGTPSKFGMPLDMDGLSITFYSPIVNLLSTFLCVGDFWPPVERIVSGFWLLDLFATYTSSFWVLI